MTLNQRITTLLESKGWKYHYSVYDYESNTELESYWVDQHGMRQCDPDLANSLDACKAVFEADESNIIGGYLAEVYKMATGKHIGDIHCLTPLELCSALNKILHATPAQRIQAYLRFKGLWKD